jgi:hypothetical protein
MVYKTQNHGVHGILPLSAILNNWKSSSKGPNRVDISLPSSDDGKRFSFREVTF